MKFSRCLPLALASCIGSATAGDGPGGVGTTNGDLRLWLKADGLTTPPSDISPPRMASWTDNSGSGLALTPNTGQGRPGGRVFEDHGVRRDTKFIVDPANAWLYLKLDETAGTTARDRFSSGRNGTHFGGPVGGVRFYGSTGLEFDGVNDTVQLPAIPELNAADGSTPFQISVWIKPNDFGGVRRILSSDRIPAAGGTPNSGGWGFGLEGNNLRFTAYGILDHIYPTNFKAGVWSHLGIKVGPVPGSPSQRRVQVSVNGVSAGSRDFATINPAGGAWVVGHLPTSDQYFHGAIADLIVAADSDYRNDAEFDVPALAIEQPNNNIPMVRLNSADNESYVTPSAWQPQISDSFSLFTVARYKGDGFAGDSPAPFQQTLFRAASQKLVVMLPDAQGRIGFYSGNFLNFPNLDGPSLNDPNAGFLYHPFNHGGPDDAHGFRSFAFASSPAGGSRIYENGRLLASKPASIPTGGISGPFSIGNDSILGAAGTKSHDVSEVILYNRDLNPTERVLLENHLAAKFHQSTPGKDWYAGDEKRLGDFDRELIGIANLGSNRHEHARGGGLEVANISALGTSGERSLMFGRKTGGLRANSLPSGVAMAWPHWWYADARGLSGGQIALKARYDDTGLVRPPAVPHHLLFSPALGAPFEIVATADRVGGVVDFGPLDVGGPDSPLRTGYYAIGYGHSEAVPAVTYEFRYLAAHAGPPSRAGNVWTFGPESLQPLPPPPPPLPPPPPAYILGAGNELNVAINEINQRPNDGSVVRLDLTGLVLTADPGSAKLIIGGTYPIRRNLVIEGPESLIPGRLNLKGRLEIQDATVEIRNLTICDNVHSSPVSGGFRVGGAIAAQRADLLLENVVIRDNQVIGSIVQGNAGTRLGGSNGAFGQGGRRGSELSTDLDPHLALADTNAIQPGWHGGDGGFGGGGGGGLDLAGMPYGTMGGSGGFGACDGMPDTDLPITVGYSVPSGERGALGAAAGFGGGVFLYRGALRIKSCAFINNSAIGGTGGRRRLNDGTYTSQAAGLGGAIFAWDEARIATISEDSGFVDNTASSDSFLDQEPIPEGITASLIAFGIDAPSNEVYALREAANFITPIIGVLNPSAPLAYQFTLYRQSGSGQPVIPDYELLDDSKTVPKPGGGTFTVGPFANPAALANFDAMLEDIDAYLATNPSSDYAHALSLDLRFHQAMVLNMSGDRFFQDCVERPLDPGVVTNLDSDVTDLTSALDRYRTGLRGYIDYLVTPEGAHTFQTKVPGLPYLQCFYLSAAAPNVYLEVPGPGGTQWAQTRYRDLAMLVEMLNDYTRTAWQLSDTLVRRNNATDREDARSLVADALFSAETWADVIFALLPPESVPMSDSLTPGLAAGLGTFRASVNQLNTRLSSLSGTTNPIGYSEDFLMLIPPSGVPGTPNNFASSFHSFQFFTGILFEPGPRQPKGVLLDAVNSLHAARIANTSFVNSQAAIAGQAVALKQEYRARLKKISGKFPGEAGFDTPHLNQGSEIWEQYQKIQAARAEVERNRIRISTLSEEIDIEIRRNEQEKGINISRDDLTIEYGDKVAKIDDQIAAIEVSQNALAGITDVLDPSLMVNPAGLFTLGVKLANVGVQAGAEVGKLQLEKQKDELAAQQMKDQTSLTNQLLDVNSRALIATRLLAMKELDLDSQLTAANVEQEVARIVALLDERAELLGLIDVAEQSMDTRFHADPSARLAIQAAFQKAQFDFVEARQWVFFASRALEFKWNRKFEKNGFNESRLYQIRSADELVSYYSAMVDFDNDQTTIPVVAAPTEWFSLRKDFFGIDSGVADPGQAFRDRILVPGILDTTNKIIEFDFSTVREIPGSSFFRGATFDGSGNVVGQLRGNYLDKIQSIKVLLTFGGNLAPGESTTTLGTLSYGGVSYMRNPTVGSFEPLRPDRLRDELRPFSTKTWSSQTEGQGSTVTRWVQNQFPLAAQNSAFAKAREGTLQDHENAVASSNLNIINFQERPVAATNWIVTIQYADGTVPRFNLNDLTDIKIRFEHFSAPR